MTLPFTRAPVYPNEGNRRSFIGGSDARIIMGTDEAALVRLWQTVNRVLRWMIATLKQPNAHVPVTSVENASAFAKTPLLHHRA
jgi:hypothetical protein